MTKTKSPRPKHVPMRMCIGTHTQHPKREMVRVVMNADGHVVVDASSKMSGSRGAYISKSYAAAQAAVQHGRLEAEFERPIPNEDRIALLAFFEQFKDQ